MNSHARVYNNLQRRIQTILMQSKTFEVAQHIVCMYVCISDFMIGVKFLRYVKVHECLFIGESSKSYSSCKVNL